MGAVSRSGGVGSDDAVMSMSWRKPIDAWFAGIGRQVYDGVHYRLALRTFPGIADEGIKQGPRATRVGKVRLCPP